MSESIHDKQPYKKLGLRLRNWRQQRNQSLAEVSGAIEVDPELLVKIEMGASRPAEDVLMLLISHLDLQEEEASQLWELAGYDQDQPVVEEQAKPIVMLLQQDSRVMYSDMVNVVTSPQGVVVNFLQAQGKGQATPVSRIGMSHQQALQVIEALQQSLQPVQRVPKPDQAFH